MVAAVAVVGMGVSSGVGALRCPTTRRRPPQGRPRRRRMAPPTTRRRPPQGRPRRRRMAPPPAPANLAEATSDPCVVVLGTDRPDVIRAHGHGDDRHRDRCSAAPRSPTHRRPTRENACGNVRAADAARAHTDGQRDRRAAGGVTAGVADVTVTDETESAGGEVNFTRVEEGTEAATFVEGLAALFEGGRSRKASWTPAAPPAGSTRSRRANTSSGSTGLRTWIAPRPSRTS